LTVTRGMSVFSIHQIGKDCPHPFLVKVEKLRIRHFSGGHREFPVFAAGDMSFDRDVERLIGQNQTSDICSHDLSRTSGSVASTQIRRCGPS
jgi:hypothetical protein